MFTHIYTYSRRKKEELHCLIYIQTFVIFWYVASHFLRLANAAFPLWKKIRDKYYKSWKKKIYTDGIDKRRQIRLPLKSHAWELKTELPVKLLLAAESRQPQFISGARVKTVTSISGRGRKANEMKKRRVKERRENEGKERI